MRDFVIKHKKGLFAVALLIVVVIISVSVFFIAQDKINSAIVKITVSPLTAKVKIGEKECDATSDCKVAPGEYDVLIYAEGFISKSGKLVIASNESVELATYLEPTDENTDWYENHPWDATARGDIASNEALQDFYNLREVEPILNYVPYSTYTYSINYEENCAENNNKLCLVLKGNLGTSDMAVTYLQNTRQDLSRYFMKNGEDEVFKNVAVDIPRTLDFEENGTFVGIEFEVSNIQGAALDFARKSLANNEYAVETLQIKSFGDFCGVKVKVYRNNEDVEVYDTYRMLLYRFDDGWRAVTNLGMILSKYVNDEVPASLLELMNAW